ncbi:FAD-dependent monooxygenase [Nocardia callitridis]|uniref:FAD-dependent monooxygenase n=1 Tax=Nocardia callitridis TaxID=648753 RepID=A0ABP9K8A1_9NOCA
MVVLEREAESGSPWRAAPLGRRGLFATSIDAFYRRGMLPQLRAAGHTFPGAPGPSAPRIVGHFAGMMIDGSVIDPAAAPYQLPRPAPGMLMTSLTEIEEILAARAEHLGVRVHYGAAVTELTQEDKGVLVRAGDDEYAARWVVGCDGGRSTVRKLAGFEFVGTEPQFTGYTMRATIPDLDKLGTGMITTTPTGAYIRMSIGQQVGHVAIMDFDGGAFDRSRELTRDYLQSVLRRVSGTDVTIEEVQLASSFTDRAMQTTSYRRGRVLLAGDAAHIHSPLGGQGLNTGLGDAGNLGWKLAATVLDDAQDDLLDSYTRERHPIGARVLDWSRAQVEVMRPDAHSRATRSLLRDLLATRDGATYAAQKVSGACIRYDLGDQHPLVGRDVPDFHLEGGSRLGDLMHEGQAVLLDFSADRALRAPVANWANKIRYSALPARDNLGLAAVLIRPDGIVAWAVDHDPDRGEFEHAAGRWFGKPVLPAAAR